MITLYHCVSARSFRCLWMLEELGLPYELKMLPFPQTLVLRYGRFEPVERRLPSVAQDYGKWFLARLRSLEPLLAQQDHLCAGRFTAADASVGYALLLAQHLGLASRFTPAVHAWWERLQQREGFRRALQSQHAGAVAQGVSTVAAPDTAA